VSRPTTSEVVHLNIVLLLLLEGISIDDLVVPFAIAM
jgi:hypothetical protein